MTRNRSMAIGAFFLVILIIGGGWFLEISPQLAAVASAHDARAQVLILNAKNQLLLTKLKTDYRNIAPLKKQLDLLTLSVPSKGNISSFISELNSLSITYSVTIKSIQFSDAKPYSLAPQAPVTSGIKGPPSPQSSSKITSANFVVIPLQLAISGDYAKVLEFINGVQMGPRLFLISTFSSTGSSGTGAPVTIPLLPGRTPGQVDATIGGYIYVLLN